jgi:FMN phosphatase YigB (HAD superfamily)
MLAARNAGVKSIYINRSGRPIKADPDYEIDSLEKLDAIVNGKK